MGRTLTGVERALLEVDGVIEATASPRTGNVLVRYDPVVTDEHSIVGAVASAAADCLTNPGPTESAAVEGAGRLASEPEELARLGGRTPRRVRISLAGLERDPELGRRAVELLEGRTGIVRVVPSPLTGRVLVELAPEVEDEIDVDRLADELRSMEPPGAEFEEVPRHPLERSTTVQGSARVIGAACGLALIFARRVAGATRAATTSRAPAVVAGLATLGEAMPPLAGRLEELLGYERRDLTLGVAAMVGLTLSDGALGLVVTGAAALRRMTEARDRRAEWQDYESRITAAEAAIPGRIMKLGAGARLPLPGRVLEGSGTAIAEDGQLVPISQGTPLSAGSRLNGESFRIRLESLDPPIRGDAPVEDRAAFERYMNLLPLAASGIACAVGVATRSPARAFATLLLVNPRPAVLGSEAADHSASARALRSGVTVVGSRAGRPVQHMDHVLLDSPRLLVEGHELAHAMALERGWDTTRLVNLAAGISAAAGSPWGNVFPLAGHVTASHASFDGRVAHAEIEGERWTLRMEPETSAKRVSERARPNDQVLILSKGEAEIGALLLRPRLHPGHRDLVAACKEGGTVLELVCQEPRAATREIASRAGLRLTMGVSLAQRAQVLRSEGHRVAVVADGAQAAQAFEECDLAIGLGSGRRGPFAARADLLAATPDAVAALIESGNRRDLAVRDALWLSVLANVVGLTWDLAGRPTAARAGTVNHVAGLMAIASAWLRLRGGRRSRSVVERLADPGPERWGRQSTESVLETFESRPNGLSTAEAETRHRPRPDLGRQTDLTGAAWAQLESPLTAALAGAALFSFGLGALGDMAMLVAVIGVNTAVGVWQERQAGDAAKELSRVGAQRARVVRDGIERDVHADELVPGDVIVVTSGDRIPADARLIGADALEVDEAALRGEAFPAPKSRDGASAEERILLEGTDVTTGSGRAIVVAVGQETRMGATTAALALRENGESPLTERLDRIFRQALPVIAGGGAVVALSGILWRRATLAQIALGTSVAVGALPEGLPLLAGVAEAGVARRLSRRHALLHRLSAVEALGRVDVACCDKTGTMTTGQLAVTAIADAMGRDVGMDDVEGTHREVLVAAALASPDPDAPDAASHPTDVAILEAADSAGLGGEIRRRREAETPFDPSRGFHAAAIDGRLLVKGAAEVVVELCSEILINGQRRRLDTRGRERLLGRVERLAGQGLRVLMVAERSGGDPGDPRDLCAVGLLGISDPLRPHVRAAVRRCRDAHVRVIMLTGDHAATARSAAREAGVVINSENVLTGTEINDLDDERLTARLREATVIARISPLDKVRIVELLQRDGHVVAMTGDGVNDAPALRLADVGVAMGDHGTEVARQAADLVLADDDFATLVEALVEGRGFWRNLRRALGLLLGGNLGEIALMAVAGAIGLPSPMTTRQVLALNLVTDVLPAVAVAVQEPQTRELGELARERDVALDDRMRSDIVRRGTATALPSIAAYAAASRTMTQPAASGVAFVSVVSAQLAQTLELGRAEDRLTGSVTAAAGASAAVLLASITYPPARSFLGFANPGLVGVSYAGASVVAALATSRALRGARRPDSEQTKLALTAAPR